MPNDPNYLQMGAMGLGLLNRPGQQIDPMQQALGGYLQQQRRQQMPGGPPGQPGAPQQPMSLLDMLPGLATRHPLGGLGGGGYR